MSSSSYGVVVCTRNMVPGFDLLQLLTEPLIAGEYQGSSTQLHIKGLELVLVLD